MPMSPRLLRPRQTGFDPRSISGLALWLDAADFSSVTLNSGNVSEWRDKSGNARNVTQSTASNQPTYTTSGQNGRNCLTFSQSGSGRRLSAASASNWAFLHDGSQLWSIFIVASCDSTSGSGNVGTYLSTRGTYNAYTTRGFDMTHDFGGIAANNNIRCSISTSSAMVARRDMSATGAGVVRCYQINGDPANATSTARLGFTHTAGGTSNATSSANAAQAGDPSGVFTIGVNATGAVNPLAGKICEIVIYSRATAISAAEASRVNAYLARKWGI